MVGPTILLFFHCFFRARRDGGTASIMEGQEGQPGTAGSPRGRGRQSRPIMMEGQPGTAGSPRGRGRQRAASKGLLPNWRAAWGGASESSIDWRAEAAPRAFCPIGGTREELTLFSARHETSVCRGEPPRNLTPVGERHPCARPLSLPSRARVHSGPGTHIRFVRSASHTVCPGCPPSLHQLAAADTTVFLQFARAYMLSIFVSMQIDSLTFQQEGF
jgi:hypothetical protein